MQENTLEFGKVAEVHLPGLKDKHFNFGYVVFEKPSAAAKFFEEGNGTRFMGRELK